MRKKILFIIPFLVLALTSCKKERHNDVIGNRLDMIYNTKWRVADIVDNGKHIALGCKSDDLWYFNVDGHSYLKDGNNSCGIMDSIAFTYGITGDQRFLYLWDMAAPTYGAYHTDSYRLDAEITYMTATDIGIKYYDQGTSPSTSHQYEIAFVRVP